MKQVKQFFASAPEKSFRKGNILLNPEDKIKNIYYLTQGNVKQYVVSKGGEELTVHIFRPGAFFPIMLAMRNAPNRFYFTALTDIKVKISPSNKVVEFLKKEQVPLYDLAVRFAQGIDGLTVRLESLLSESAANRISSLLLYLSDKFGKTSPEGTKIDLSLSQQEIAGWVGLERETVSRQMKVLSDEGLISYKKQKITVIDVKKFAKQFSN